MYTARQAKASLVQHGLSLTEERVETRLRTIEQLEQFLRATPRVVFAAHGPGDAAENQRYEHISGVLARFDYPGRKKRKRGVVLAYLRRTSGYGRAQMARLC